MEVLYRYVDVSVAHFDLDGDYCGSTERLSLHVFKVIRHTPKGKVILDMEEDRERWISNTAKKRFAYPTEREALTSYKFRKLRYQQLLQARLKFVERCIDLAIKQENYLDKEGS